MAIDVLEKRPTVQMHTVHTCGDVQVDVDSRVTLIGGRRVTLTYGEFELLLKLVADPGRAFSRGELRGDHPGAAASALRAVDLRIMRLRKKLAGARDFTIETVPHIGYRCWSASRG
jgi:DNA-binding response OmpR family regulator